MAILHTICMFCSLERYLELDLIRKDLPVGFTSHGTVFQNNFLPVHYPLLV